MTNKEIDDRIAAFEERMAALTIKLDAGGTECRNEPWYRDLAGTIEARARELEEMKKVRLQFWAEELIYALNQEAALK